MQILIDGKLENEIEFDNLYKTLHLWLHTFPERINMTRITPVVVEFNGDVLVGHVLIAESHIDIHAVKRSLRVFVDIFSCKSFDKEFVVSAVINELKINPTNIRVLSRGLEYLDKESAEKCQEVI